MIVPNYQTFRAAFATSPTPLALDGHPVWPVANLRAGGFTGDIFGASQPITELPLLLTVNAYAPDTVLNVDEYDWYVSQRTDVRSKQLLQALPYMIEGQSATRSGTIQLEITDLGVSVLGLASATSPLSTAQVERLFKHVIVYCQRRTGKYIKYIDLLTYSQG